MKHLLLLALCLFTLTARAQEPRMEVIDLRQVPLADAARILSEASGLNVVASVEAGKTIVSLYLANVEPRAAIEALCRSHNLWFRDDEKSGIIRIHTPEEYQRDLGSFQEELTETFDLRFPNAEALGNAIRDLFGNRVRINQNSQQEQMQETQELQQRFQRFDILDGRSQQLGFSSNQGGGGGFNNSQNGLGGGNTRNGNNSLNSLFGAGMQQNFGNRFGNAQNQQQAIQPQRIEGLSAEEIQSLQVNAAEDRTAAVQRLLDERVDIFVTVIQRLNKVLVRTSDSRAMEQIRKLMLSIDVPTPTVLLEVKILRVRLDQGYRSAVDYLFNDGTTQVGFGTGAVNAGDLAFRYASGNFSAQIQVLEEKGQVRVVSTPTLLIANNEVSRLFIGEERPLNRSFNGGAVIPGAANNVVVNGSTDIEFRPVGTTLLITPNINADKTVTLRLLQENSNINVNGASVLVPNNNGFTRQTVDTVQSRTVSGTVVAKDQVPVVIGGLIDTNFTDTRAQVPLLGNIPLVGILFGKRQDTKTRDELVLLISPHIIDGREGGAAASKDVLDANNVQALQSFTTKNEVNDRLQKHLPPPAPPRAQPVSETASKPKKRTLIDMIRGRH
jgi:general secretion pathway protein D